MAKKMKKQSKGGSTNGNQNMPTPKMLGKKGCK